jgi:transposase
MKSYSVDLRERIVAARLRGESAAEVARRFGVSKRSVERYWKLQQQNGSVAGKRRGGYRRSVLEGHDGRLRRWIAKEPGLTLAQLGERIRKQLHVSLGPTALWHRLERLGLSYKKNAARRRTGPARTARRPGTLARAAAAVARRPARLPR